MTLPITVVVPSIPARTRLLQRALDSIDLQMTTPQEVIVITDTERLGAAETRQRGLARVTTPWVAFLDDDDVFKPNHLEALHTCALETEADYVYSWFDVIGGTDPFPQFFGKPWNPAEPHQTTVTTLVRTDLALGVGGFVSDPALLDPSLGDGGQEDWQFTLRCNAVGARIIHLPERTWLWYHHGRNTSGLASRQPAIQTYRRDPRGRRRRYASNRGWQPE